MKSWIRHSSTLLIAPLAFAMLVTEAPAQQGEPIKVGTSLPLTGGRSVNGEKHRKGFVLCVEMINEKGGLSRSTMTAPDHAHVLAQPCGSVLVRRAISDRGRSRLAVPAAWNSPDRNNAVAAYIHE